MIAMMMGMVLQITETIVDWCLTSIKSKPGVSSLMIFQKLVDFH